MTHTIVMDHAGKEDPVRSYGQFCPMAMALEVLGERWTLLIVRELLLGSSHFNDLARCLPGISRTLLAARLRQLERDGIVVREAAGSGRRGTYRLTQAGQELLPVAEALAAWGTRWAFGEPRPDQLDPVLLLWWLHRDARRERLPQQRTVVQFDFRGACQDSMWLLLDAPEVSVCLTPPGETDILVTADLATLYRVWAERISLGMALRAELVQLEGLPALVRAFPAWWGWSASDRATASLPPAQ
jgi:DNA-binding HxlR family transcriptional regulator